MSLSYLRDAIIKSLEERADKLANVAINFRVQAVTSTDEYAMNVADTLAQARAYTDAIKIVIAEYKKMTEAEQPNEMASDPQKQQQNERNQSVY